MRESEVDDNNLFQISFPMNELTPAARLMVIRFVQWLRGLNLFPTGATNADTVQNERWSTRLYIICFLTLLVVFLIFGGLEKQIIIVNVNNPSYANFQELQEEYSDSLKCPCTKVAIQYDTFLQVQPIFHQVMLS